MAEDKALLQGGRAGFNQMRQSRLRNQTGSVSSINSNAQQTSTSSTARAKAAAPKTKGAASNSQQSSSSSSSTNHASLKNIEEPPKPIDKKQKEAAITIKCVILRALAQYRLQKMFEDEERLRFEMEEADRLAMEASVRIERRRYEREATKRAEEMRKKNLEKRLIKLFHEACYENRMEEVEQLLDKTHELYLSGQVRSSSNSIADNTCPETGLIAGSTTADSYLDSLFGYNANGEQNNEFFFLRA